MKIFITILIFLALIFTSCSESDKSVQVDKFDYLIFGHFRGECEGEECVETFKLTEDKLYKDTLDDYRGENLDFFELSSDIFQQVRDLKDYFPNELYSSRGEMIGCPDCRDQGGIFIQYSENGIVESWRIDTDKSKIPSYLHDFIDKVKEKIRLINK